MSLIEELTKIIDDYLKNIDKKSVQNLLIMAPFRGDYSYRNIHASNESTNLL